MVKVLLLPEDSKMQHPKKKETHWCCTAAPEKWKVSSCGKNLSAGVSQKEKLLFPPAED